MKSGRHVLSFKEKFAYALPAFSLAAVGIPVYVYIPKFYTDVMGVNLTFVGGLIFSVRIFDAVTDPFIGWVSDKTETKMGRRRPYILFGSVLLAFAVFFLFAPPLKMTILMRSIWFAVWMYALFLFWTITTVPYESFGPELSRDYTERTSLFAMRDGFLIFGTLIAASAPTLIKEILGVGTGREGEVRTFYFMAIIYAPLMVGTAYYCVRQLREKPVIQATESVSMRESFRLVRKNRPFMILLFAFTIGSIGSNLPAAMILYYVQYVLKSSHSDIFLILYFITGIIFLPVWIRVAERMGKKETWILSMLINTLAFVGVFFLKEGDVWIYALLVIVSGIGFGAAFSLPSSLQADVIDYDELISGKRREGYYVGMWSVSKKLSAAMGVGIGLTVLGMSGYIPNAQQSDRVLQVIRSFYALIPSLCNLIAIAIAVSYPLNGQMHEKIMIAIDRRKRGSMVSDPLNPKGSLLKVEDLHSIEKSSCVGCS